MGEPWTPGPWEWVGVHDYDFLPDHQLFEGLEWSTWEQGGGPRVVIDRDRDTGYDGCVHDEEFIRIKSADARLIALAPEMAEFISDAIGWWADQSKMAARARDLLARARGETP